MSGEGGSFKNPANLFDRSNWGALASGLGVSPHWIKTHPTLATAAATAAAAYFTGGASLGAMGATEAGATAAPAAAGWATGAGESLGGGLGAAYGMGEAAIPAGSALYGASGLTDLAGATGSDLASAPSVAQPGLLAQVGQGVQNAGFQAGLPTGWDSSLGKGLSKFGKTAKAMEVAGLLNPQQSGPPPGHAPQSYGPQPQNTILYPSQQTNLSQVGAPIGIDERDPRYLAWLAAHGRAA